MRNRARNRTGYVFLTGLCLSLAACSPGHTFSSGFETIGDFSGFYLTPQPHLNTSTWSLQSGTIHGGTNAFLGTIAGANAASTDSINNNHRAYPTLQFHKSSGGVFHTPVLVTLWVNLNMTLAAGQWFSFATFVSDTSDIWNRTVLVNLDDQGYVNLMHVPYQSQGTLIRRNTSVLFPMNQWVELKIYLDFTPDSKAGAGVPRGYAMVWQDGQLISTARVGGMGGVLAQAHFGVYAPPSVTAATLYNDDLSIVEVAPMSLQ
jgi:hypothetical protein